MTTPFLEQVRIVSGWDDAALADVLRIPRATVNAYRLGRRVEYLSADQKADVLAALHAWRTQLGENIALLEMLS